MRGVFSKSKAYRGAIQKVVSSEDIYLVKTMKGRRTDIYIFIPMRGWFFAFSHSNIV